MDVVSGADVGEDVAWHLEFPPARHERLADFRVAILPLIDWLPVDAEISNSLEELVAACGKREPRSVRPNRGPLATYGATTSSIPPSWRPEHPPRRRRRTAGAAPRRCGRAPTPSAMHWPGVSRPAHPTTFSGFGTGSSTAGPYREFFTDWDVLLAPNNITVAFPHTDEPWPKRRLDINGEVVFYGLQTAYPAVATLSGQPSTAFPTGLTKAGLPIGCRPWGHTWRTKRPYDSPLW